MRSSMSFPFAPQSRTSAPLGIARPPHIALRMSSAPAASAASLA
jgi:hypothetical protein